MKVRRFRYGRNTAAAWSPSAGGARSGPGTIWRPLCASPPSRRSRPGNVCTGGLAAVYFNSLIVGIRAVRGPGALRAQAIGHQLLRVGLYIPARVQVGELAVRAVTELVRLEVDFSSRALLAKERLDHAVLLGRPHKIPCNPDILGLA